MAITGLSRTVSEKNGDFRPKLKIFAIPVYLTLPLTEFSVEFCNFVMAVALRKLRSSLRQWKTWTMYIVHCVSISIQYQTVTDRLTDLSKQHRAVQT